MLEGAERTLMWKGEWLTEEFEVSEGETCKGKIMSGFPGLRQSSRSSDTSRFTDPSIDVHVLLMTTNTLHIGFQKSHPVSEVKD